MSRSLRLRRVQAGQYADESKGVRIEFDGTDAWILVVDGSWITTQYTKRACVDEWIRQQERTP